MAPYRLSRKSAQYTSLRLKLHAAFNNFGKAKNPAVVNSERLKFFIFWIFVGTECSQSLFSSVSLSRTYFLPAQRYA